MKLAPAEIRAVIALAVGMFCVQVDFFALNLALPRMAVDLNETTTNMQWVISAYMIAVGAAMIPGGRLGDLRGHRRIVVAGLAVFGGASLVCGLSSSYGLLIGFRALQGLGARRCSPSVWRRPAMQSQVIIGRWLSVPSSESRTSEPHSARSSADF
jgi:MFS family permease